MKRWQILGSIVQAIVLGTALAIALAKFFMSAAGISVFKYQGF